MAKDTLINLRNQVMYCIYVRNYGPNGTFKDVENDLNRIKDLGTDIIWFMPIHPIGVEGKKGSLGCPYSIKDYREINPEYGTMKDFKELVDKIHDAGMKCIIDVVYNHTSKDSRLLTEHPEYFYRKEDGTLCRGKNSSWGRNHGYDPAYEEEHETADQSVGKRRLYTVPQGLQTGQWIRV